ncbi:MAG: hypothetical protein JWR22_882 [Herminiimonas sp.]|nr:hypothetical protein [Herminiimonas sp.]
MRFHMSATLAESVSGFKPDDTLASSALTHRSK